MIFSVLGAGLQGSACALDLLRNPAVTEVRIGDRSFERLPTFLESHVGKRLSLHTIDARDARTVASFLRGSRAAMCAMPYTFNLPLAHAAVSEGVHFCDLGGNTEIVFRQRDELDDLAKAHGVSVVPDCGLAPGLVNILAEMGIRECDEVFSVRLYVGGLPQHPEPPLNYQLVYSLHGMLDYATTPSWVLRDGKRVQVSALSERETVRFESLGELEAFHTGGGLSTMAFRYEGRIPVMEYKTLRYPGHAEILQAIRDLGFFSLDPVRTETGVQVVPRDLAITLMDEKLRKPNSPDLVALRVVVEGRRNGADVRHAWELVDKFDAALGVTAMMRTTGYSLSITGQMQSAGDIDVAGVHTPDECVPGAKYLAALKERGVEVVRR